MPSTQTAPDDAPDLTFTPPAISLPNCGGAIHGIREICRQARYRQGSKTVPIAATRTGPSRFGPDHCLAYGPAARISTCGGDSRAPPFLARTEKGFRRIGTLRVRTLSFYPTPRTWSSCRECCRGNRQRR